MFVASCLGLSLVGVSAQEKTEGTAPPRIVFEHDGKGVTGFVLYAQPEKGKPLRINLGLVMADATGARAIPMPLLPEGTYSLSVAAYNAAGESPAVPTSPARLSIRIADAPPGPIGAPHPGHQDVSPAPPAPARNDGSKGVFGRLWKVLVGD
jgi:hypothetical protein